LTRIVRPAEFSRQSSSAAADPDERQFPDWSDVEQHETHSDVDDEEDDSEFLSPVWDHLTAVALGVLVALAAMMVGVVQLIRYLRALNP
jgi:hypothetical protein